MAGKKIQHKLDGASFTEVRRILNDEIRPVDVARLLESSPPNERRILWSLIDRENTGAVLRDMDDDVREDILQALDSEVIAETIEQLSDDDITDILQQLPDRVIREVMQQMEADDRKRIQKLLNYPEGTAGALMTTEVLTIRPNITLEVVLRYLRRADQPIQMGVGKLAVTDKNNKLLGMLPLNELVRNTPSKRVVDVMEDKPIKLKPKDDDEKVISVFERYNMVSVPVTDTRNNFLGLIAVDDVLDVVLRRSSKALMGGGIGVTDEDTFAPIRRVGRRRTLWLGLNLLTVVLASFFIGLFEDTLEQVVALAVLMPIVAGMGGVAGLQSMTVMVRAQALGRINASNIPWLFMRESGIGLMNGLLWAAVACVLAYFWFNNFVVVTALGMGLIINMLVGCVLGVAIPLLLEKSNVDPADAGGVFLTTSTDIIGFVIFLGIASFFYA